MKPGATVSTLAITRSAYAASSSACGASAYWCGTHWVNIDITCCPGGASESSNTLGMQMSANGSAEGRPATASWNAVSMSSRLSASTIVPAVHLRVELGMAGEHRQPGQRQIDLHGAAAGLPAADVLDEIGRQHRRVEQPQERDLRVRGGDDGRRVDVLAAGQRHPGDPAIRRVRILATSAPVRSSAPNERAAAASAPVTPPMPPRGKPHAPACPSVSPMWWCSIT